MPGAAQHKPPTDFRLQAAIWTLIGALFFALMNSVAKYLGLMDGPHDGVDRSVPVLQVTFARYAVAALIVLPFVAMQPDRFQMSAPFRYVVRTGAGFGGIAFMFLAVSLIPLAAATAIGFTSPIFAMLIAALMLSEKVTFRQWIGAVIGLAGAGIIAAPGESFVAAPTCSAKSEPCSRFVVVGSRTLFFTCRRPLLTCACFLRPLARNQQVFMQPERLDFESACSRPA